MTAGWTEAIHAVVVPVNVSNVRVGMVLIWKFSDATRATPTQLWDPRTNSFYATIIVDTNTSPNSTPFCSGHSFLPDGTLVVTGGDFIDPNSGNIINVGTIDVIQFDPAPQGQTFPVWRALGSLNDPVDPLDPNGPLAGGRWYPTNVTAKVPNQPERVFTFSGRNKLQDPIRQTNHTVERYDRGSDAWQLQSRDNLGFLNSEAWYPRLHLMATGLATGQILFAGPETETWLYNPANTGPNDNPWTNLQTPRNLLRSAGTSVLLPSTEGGKVMAVGGFRVIFQTPPRCEVADTAEIIDFSAQTPQWQLVANRMSSPRANLNAVTLPDGQVIFLGGETACSTVSPPGQGNDPCSNCTPVYTADLFNPLTSSWLTIPAPAVGQQRPRQYHSTAVLLPDGRVLLAGGDTDNCGIICPCNGPPCPSGQIYNPGYLFRGSRPAITSSPLTISYGTQFNVNVNSPGAAPITNVLLIRLGAATHAFNNEQRSITLQFTQQGNTLTVTPPPNTDVSRYVAPAGYYMLLVVTGQGANQIPSPSQLVQLVDPTTQGFWSRRR